MKSQRSLPLPFLLIVPLLFFSSKLSAFDPASTFRSKCGACHTLGGGDLVGPDLKGVTERRTEDWLLKFISSPQKMIKGGDPVATELLKKYKNITMPDQPLSPGGIKALLEYIKGGGKAEEAPATGQLATTATEEDKMRGRDFFLGRLPFSAGGPSCVSCHRAADVGPLGGGTMAVDLSQVYSRYGDEGLSAALAEPPFPMMREVFAKKPITSDEAFALKAFLYEIDRKGAEGDGTHKKFVFLGLGGSVVMMGIFDFVWRKRRKRSTKPWFDRLTMSR